MYCLFSSHENKRHRTGPTAKFVYQIRCLASTKERRKQRKNAAKRSRTEKRKRKFKCNRMNANALECSAPAMVKRAVAAVNDVAVVCAPECFDC